jgi:hypothetical protein
LARVLHFAFWFSGPIQSHQEKGGILGSRVGAPDGRVENQNQVSTFPRGARDDSYGISGFRIKNQGRISGASFDWKVLTNALCLLQMAALVGGDLGEHHA